MPTTKKTASEVDEKQQNTIEGIEKYPVIPLRDVVIFPKMVVPLFVGRASSIQALELALKKDTAIVLIAQKQAEIDDPKDADLFSAGTLAKVMQLLRLPDGTVKVLVEAQLRVIVTSLTFDKNYIQAEIQPVDTMRDDEVVIEARARSIDALFHQYVKLNKKIPPEILNTISNVDEAEHLADIIAGNVSLKLEDKQRLLELASLDNRLELLIQLIENEINILRIEKSITSRVQKKIEKHQREHYLRTKMDAIREELGTLEEYPDDIELLKQKVKKAGMSDEAREKAEAEIRKLSMMSPFAPEATVSRNYLESLLAVPWKKVSKVNDDLDKAAKILDAEHDGLEKVKERILEYLAVQNRVKKLKGPILCLVGAPGVGKTSLGKSIAHATGRKFVRISLGGVRDEAEIRGHRRTYIGALPGKIIQNVIKSGVKNPLFLLDEVDKMSMDFRGDPASALLEVLDPEQNNTFNDHYLEVDYDLSDVMFITTANTYDIPLPLLDRMETIHLSGYTEEEKVSIATNHLIPKQLKENGLKRSEIKFSDEVIRQIIRYYTREAGVRGLEREIAKICRKVVKEILFDKSIKCVTLTLNNLEKYLGVEEYQFDEVGRDDQIGQVTGLAWTEVGGEILTIEAAVLPGEGKSIVTGQLGEVMQESIQAASTVVRSHLVDYGLKPDFFKKHDVHIHVPEGAIPKDGPSAGVAMCTALVSVMTKIPVRADVAMTGEITLRGEILPIGGLKEKLLAARRSGISHVIIPVKNEKDLKDIPANVKDELHIHPLRWIQDVLDLALVKKPQKPLKEKE
ncbi:MAG: endopeptidase La [Pseudomonadota bacterium]|nr:endopeptidase La [Gammaproteobacteria bacterium]MBU1926296.1 endopeptidase La [Gammaproteobacteria bacterium]MBU2545627.1 endopeptidase La [Gammaproteobacteria bacterium]